MKCTYAYPWVVTIHISCSVPFEINMKQKNGMKNMSDDSLYIEPLNNASKSHSDKWKGCILTSSQTSWDVELWMAPWDSGCRQLMSNASWKAIGIWKFPLALFPHHTVALKPCTVIGGVGPVKVCCQTQVGSSILKWSSQDSWDFGSGLGDELTRRAIRIWWRSQGTQDCEILKEF